MQADQTLCETEEKFLIFFLAKRNPFYVFSSLSAFTRTHCALYSVCLLFYTSSLRSPMFRPFAQFRSDQHRKPCGRNVTFWGELNLLLLDHGPKIFSLTFGFLQCFINTSSTTVHFITYYTNKDNG